MSYFSENEIAAAMTVKLDDVLPEKTVFQEGIRRAPDRGFRLTQAQTEIALKNALRYIPKRFHEEVIPEFLEELKTRGRIYGCLLYTSPSPRDVEESRMPSSA